MGLNIRGLKELMVKSAYTTLKSWRDKTIVGSIVNWKKHACPEHNIWGDLLRTASGFSRNDYQLSVPTYVLVKNQSCVEKQKWNDALSRNSQYMRHEAGWGQWEVAPCLVSPVQNAMPASWPTNIQLVWPVIKHISFQGLFTKTIHNLHSAVAHLYGQEGQCPTWKRAVAKEQLINNNNNKNKPNK